MEKFAASTLQPLSMQEIAHVTGAEGGYFENYIPPQIPPLPGSNLPPDDI